MTLGTVQSFRFDYLARIHQTRDGRFGSKVGQIGPKWDKSGAFSDQISVHLAPRAKCTEIWSEKATDLSHLGSKSDPLWSQTYHPWWASSSTTTGVRLGLNWAKLPPDGTNRELIKTSDFWKVISKSPTFVCVQFGACLAQLDPPPPSRLVSASRTSHLSLGSCHGLDKFSPWFPLRYELYGSVPDGVWRRLPSVESIHHVYSQFYRPTPRTPLI